jgi:hypothetical protein
MYVHRRYVPLSTSTLVELCACPDPLCAGSAGVHMRLKLTSMTRVWQLLVIHLRRKGVNRC